MTTSGARSARPRRARARRGDGALLRQEILDAAARLLVATGDEALVSIRAVADAVGVTPPSIYLHFADKDALMLAVCEATFRAFDADQEAAAATESTPLESLRARGRAYVRFGLTHPEQYRILFMTRSNRSVDMAARTEDLPAGAVAFLHLVDAVRRCMAAGDLASADPMLVALQLWTGLHGVVALLICEQGFPWPPVDVLVEAVLDMQARGLAPGPTAPQRPYPA